MATSSGIQYRQTSVDRNRVQIHHIVWLLHYKYWPTKQIDHIDGDGLNNRISNLREVSDAENKKNLSRRIDNKSGHIGVSWNKKARKWVAQINANGTNKYLGLFSNLDDAIKERQKASNHYGYHENHGRS